MPAIELRPYREEDCVPTRQVFERAVRLTASGDYSEEQVEAWAPAETSDSDLATWSSERLAARTIVAVEGDEVLGFSDLVGGNLLDMLYVEPRAGRRGVATALLDRILSLARDGGADVLETDASLTARAFFEAHDFVVVEEQAPVLRSVAMTNFRMRRRLG